MMSSAAEAEIVVLCIMYYNNIYIYNIQYQYTKAQKSLPLRVTCNQVGHIQPAIPIRTDKNMVSGIINDIFNQTRSKAINMGFYWFRSKCSLVGVGACAKLITMH